MFIVSCNEVKPGCTISLVLEDCVVTQHGKFYREECAKRDSPVYIINKDGALVYARKFNYPEIEQAKQEVLKSKEDFCPAQDKGIK